MKLKAIHPLVRFLAAATLTWAAATLPVTGNDQSSLPVATRTAHFNLDGTVAAEGYDVVAYHRNQAVKGSSEHASRYRGVTYRFATAANQAAFEAEPARYEPAFGGWCAYAMLEGDKVKIDPKTYKIVDGRLFLFYNGLFGNTLKKWNEQSEESAEERLVDRADRHWDKIIDG